MRSYVSALLLITTSALADEQSTPKAEASSAMAANGADIYVYPTRGQSERQADRDRYECHGWAFKQTGYDPSQPNLAPHQQVQVVPMPPDHTGAVNGAVAGAVIGASVTHPHESAEGALVGAVAGAMIGAASDSARAHETTKATQPTPEELAEQARLEKQAYDYRRAISACLEGRGYTVR